MTAVYMPLSETVESRILQTISVLRKICDASFVAEEKSALVEQLLHDLVQEMFQAGYALPVAIDADLLACFYFSLPHNTDRMVQQGLFIRQSFTINRHPLLH